MNLPTPDAEMPEDQPALETIVELVAYDEQLRQGGRESLASLTPDDGELLTPKTPDPLAPDPPAELVECLQLIEEIWPRGGARPPEPALPARIGRFEIERVLGSGGFGIVYLARDPLLKRQVALKVPRLHVLASDGLRERFRREARATAALDHPHIVPIHETGEAGPLCYIAFAYCDGPSLAQWLKLQAGDVPVRVAAGIVQQLAEAMHYSHSRGILHRDLKPSNVLLFPSRGAATGEGESLPFVPRIVDFGLARLVEDELEATGTSAVIGTPLYMAPEQALGKEEAGPSADLYALGVILYELICRRPPFVGTAPLEVLDQVRSVDPPSLRKLRKDVPRDLETICLRCLQKRPADRYASAQALAEDLTRFLTGGIILARPVAALERVWHWCQQPRRLQEMGLVVMVIQLVTCFHCLTAMAGIPLVVVDSQQEFDYLEFVAFTLGLVFGIHVPMIWVGWLMAKQRRWAVYAAQFVAVGLVVTSVSSLFGWITPPFKSSMTIRW